MTVLESRLYPKMDELSLVNIVGWVSFAARKEGNTHDNFRFMEGDLRLVKHGSSRKFRDSL
jgi:hypothetical protein